MIYVVFRSVADAQPTATGDAWVTQLRNHKVDPTIGQHGGIILEEIELTNPTIRERRTVIVGYDAEQKPITQTKITSHDRPILRQRIGDDGVTPVYTCRAIRYDAERLAAFRGWQFAVYKKKEDIPRNVVAVEEPEEPEPPDADLEALKTECKAFMAAHPEAPKVKLSRSKDALTEYLQEFREEYEDAVPAGNTADSSAA